MERPSRQRIVTIGGGSAGLWATRGLVDAASIYVSCMSGRTGNRALSSQTKANEASFSRREGSTCDMIQHFG